MNTVTSYIFQVGLEQSGQRIGMSGVWSAADGARYLTGNIEGFDEAVDANTDSTVIGRQVIHRLPGRPAVETTLPVFSENVPLGPMIPDAASLNFLDRGARQEDRHIWIRGRLANGTSLSLPGGTPAEPLIVTASTGEVTLAINKFDLLVDTFIFVGASTPVGGGALGPIASYTVSLDRFNEGVEFSAEEIVR
jgi:hypothetical protein